MEFCVSIAFDSISAFSRSSGVDGSSDEASVSETGGEGGLASRSDQHEFMKILSKKRLAKRWRWDCGRKKLDFRQEGRINISYANEKIVLRKKVSPWVLSDDRTTTARTWDNFDKIWTPLPNVCTIINDNNHGCITGK
jgi:hypothetical protein